MKNETSVIGQFSFDSSAFIMLNEEVPSTAYIFVSLKTEDINSLIDYISNFRSISEVVFSFYIEKETIELKIENCLDPEEDYDNYEMGIIINNEFYYLQHEKNCSWLKKN